MPPQYEEFEAFMRQGGSSALAMAGAFFMKNDPTFETLRSISAKLEQLGIPYAIAGGMALVAHGYPRTTEDVDILVTPEDLRKIHAALDGLGYLPLFNGSKNLRNASTKVPIEFLLTGAYPGDGKPKAVAFPNPSEVAVEIDGIRYLRLESLLELKLASGMTSPGRLKDLGDVQELIQRRKLDRTLAEKLNPFVRAKYLEIWDGAQSERQEH